MQLTSVKPMGSQALELGSGFTAWNVETDESKISPTFVKMMDLFENVETGVLAWDTILDSNPAAIHQEAWSDSSGRSG